ncbi:hypothetical protein OG586_14550 [Streptomyces murinus]|uniref:hypothetical protein n=1 Tax=Streptomyces murinus TaxID=33900 RepID=UPI002E808102|nr:hypothetical protein [Streptomyces murinus]WUD07373.1 hypothetical protein OG586_14550 [Streptomyces murinus]
MRRGLVHVLAWLLATGAAVTLSWWGVHTVMAGTAYAPPRALPVVGAGAPTTRATSATAPDAPSPHRPSRSHPASPSASPSPTASVRRSPGPSSAPTPSATASGKVKAYDTDGGHAVFELGAADATLVSATPGAGWSMQVWKTATWIRVEFSRGTDRVSVFCTWHDGPPHVEIGTY